MTEEVNVFIVWCRIDGQPEFDRLYATEQGARAYCQHKNQNTKPGYYERFTFTQAKVYGDEAFTVDAGVRSTTHPPGGLDGR